MTRVSENTPFRLAVTTSVNATPRVVAEAKGFSADSGCPYVPRCGRSISGFVSEAGTDGAIVFGAQEMVIRVGDAVHHFHPNMAKLRIVALLRGERDRMANAMRLRSGDSVLDCTCGLGTDAIVASYVVGEGGTVQTLEASPLLAPIVRRGLQAYVHPVAPVTEAMRRVRVVQAVCDEVLADLSSKSWDVVYFDPLFESTVGDSSGLDLVKLLGLPDTPTDKTIRDAVRVARRSVVMKDRLPGRALRGLGFQIVSRGRRTCFGVIDAGGEGG